MKKIVALAIVVVAGVLLPASAHAGGAAAAALGLASFAVFSQFAFGLFGPWAYAGPYYAGYYAPAVVYAAPAPAVSYYAPPVTYAPAYAAAAPQSEIVYGHGKYVLRGNGVTTAYQWVWIPNPPPPPAPR